MSTSIDTAKSTLPYHLDFLIIGFVPAPEIGILGDIQLEGLLFLHIFEIALLLIIVKVENFEYYILQYFLIRINLLFVLSCIVLFACTVVPHI